jgi:hypothetical protein
MTRNSELSQLDAPGLSSWTPQTTAEREAVREQLGRILSSAPFRNSKRFPAFLSYTVDHALTSTDPLKERTIGHEVFSRDPGYDTGQDPVVRMTAAEVRKRLSHYYQQPEHQAELIVAFQPGSYVPEFLQPSPNSAAPAVEIPATDAAAPASRLPRRLTTATLTLLVVAAIMGVLAFVAARRWSEAGADAVARFWSPIVTSSSSSPVLICIGDPSPVRDQREPVHTSDTPDHLTVPEFLRTNSVRYTDAVTVASIAGELRARGKGFRIRRPSGTELKDLRDGPVVLVGGFNNPWTLKLSEGLRFTLASDAGVPYIRDRENPESRQWQSEAADRLIHNVNETFGLITRTQDPATGHTVLTVSGLVFGTASAAECLLDADCVTSAEHLAHSPSDTQNWQVVVSAPVIGLDTGAPRVVAAYTW